MMAILPCEYCGKPTPWNMRLLVPACCRDCGHWPLFFGIAWCVFSVIVGAFGIAAWRCFS